MKKKDFDVNLTFMLSICDLWVYKLERNLEKPEEKFLMAKRKYFITQTKSFSGTMKQVKSIIQKCFFSFSEIFSKNYPSKHLLVQSQPLKQ